MSARLLFVVERPGDHFLAGAGLAGDQHAARRSGRRWSMNCCTGCIAGLAPISPAGPFGRLHAGFAAPRSCA